MVINLKNIGPIHNGEVDFSQSFTILTGLNNSGKTTMSYVAYSILNQTIDFPNLVYEGLEKSTHDDGTRLLEINLFQLYRDNARYITDTINQTSFKKIKDEYSAFISDDSEISISIHSTWVKKNLYGNSIEFPFDIRNEYNKTESLAFTSDKNSPILYVQIDSDGFDEQKIEDTFERITKLVLSKIILPKPIFFPSERQGVMVFGKEILDNRLKKYEDILTSKDLESLISNHHSKQIQYLEPINQYVSLFREVILGKPIKSKFDDVSSFIAKEIMNGEVKPSKDGDLIFHSFEKNVSPIEMSYVSSTVKSLSFLSYFLRIKSLDGQVMFIDEPEINLHPRNQINIARALVLLVNAGVNLVISTHSEYILRELNSLITLGSSMNKDFNLINSLLHKYKINRDSIIKHNVVKVYSFSSNKISENNVSQTGFVIPEIDLDTLDLNDRSTDIFYTLNEEEE